MTDRSEILTAVYDAVASTNEALPTESKLEQSEVERIIGEGAKIDSLGFVSLVVAVENEVLSAIGTCPSLAEELSDPDVGVHTLGDLVGFIAARV